MLLYRKNQCGIAQILHITSTELTQKRVSDIFLVFPDLSRDSRNIEHIINKKYPQCMACLKNSTLAKTKLTKICFEQWIMHYYIGTIVGTIFKSSLDKAPILLLLPKTQFLRQRRLTQIYYLFLCTLKVLFKKHLKITQCSYHFIKRRDPVLRSHTL